MEIVEVKAKYESAKKTVEHCTKSIQDLQARTDQLQDSLPGLTRAVEDAENVKESALDVFALSGNKQAETALKAARQAHEAAQRAYNEGHELAAATARALKKRESEFPALQKQVDSLRHQVWNSLFEQRAAEIPESVRATVKELVAIGLQCSMGLNFILPKIFPLPTNSEIQEICKDQTLKYGMDE